MMSDLDTHRAGARAHLRPGDDRGRIAGLALLGGGLLMLGTLLPWLSLFAGLQSFSGLSGLYGRLLLGLGALAILGGLWYGRSGRSPLRWGLGGVGFVALGISGWALQEVLSLAGAAGAPAADALLVPSVGPGLWVCLLAALVISGVWLINPRAPQEPVRAPQSA